MEVGNSGMGLTLYLWLLFDIHTCLLVLVHYKSCIKVILFLLLYIFKYISSYIFAEEARRVKWLIFIFIRVDATIIPHVLVFSFCFT